MISKDVVIKQLADNAAWTIERVAHEVIKRNTNVHYADKYPVQEGCLIICPAAGTHESCAMCSCSMVHVEGECGMESVRNPMNCLRCAIGTCSTDWTNV